MNAPIVQTGAVKHFLDLSELDSQTLNRLIADARRRKAARLGFARGELDADKPLDGRMLALIFDEIQCGVGRTGKFFAYEWIGVQPDIMCVAKGIGGGFPLGACLATAEAAKGMTVGTHGSTYGGNPLGMAVGNAAIDLVLATGFLEHVQSVGNYLRQQLAGLIAEHPTVFEELRGQGLMLGLKMRVPNTEFVAAARKRGLLIVGAGENVVRLLPPLIVSEEQVREAIALLSAAATDFETEKKTVAA
jgi:acetylornithine/N-succinyldiaminopimelate aminotransferase